MSVPQDFRFRWGDDNPLFTFPGNVVSGVRLVEGDAEFLTGCGLPATAAPFLDFEPPGPRSWPTVTDVWGLSGEFRRYRALGRTDRGDPLAVDETGGGGVVCLEHGNGFAPVPVNRSIRLLAESLLAYRQLVRETEDINGRGSFNDGRVPETFLKRLTSELEALDPGSTADGTFWHGELLELEAGAAAPTSATENEMDS
jgi:hypothetical protein